MQPTSIIVFGSLNMDMVQKLPRLPTPGETVSGEDFTLWPGGKGANQAYAAARLGGRVQMAGAVGEDAWGTQLLQELAEGGVDVSAIARNRTNTGAASIFVLPGGENAIVISTGANGQPPVENALNLIAKAPRGSILLCQLETPLSANLEVIRAGRQAGLVTVLDPAPARPLGPELLSSVDVLTPNQSEARTLLHGFEADSESIAEALLDLGPAKVILKLGNRGCLVADPPHVNYLAGHRVPVVDTTGAGDCFNGALALAFSEGQSFLSSARFANAAAALSVTRSGAMSSAPQRSDVEKLLNQL